MPVLPANAGTSETGKSILLYAPVPLYRDDRGLLMEDQACNGLRLWAENFETVIVMFPLAKGPVPPNWVPISRVGPALARIEIEVLPTAYRPDQFLRHLPATRRRIRARIAQADYLGFSIGGLFGDWGSVGCIEAHRMGRRYYVWTDRVESEVVRRTADKGSWRHRVRARLTHRPMAWLERALIRRAALGLFHGRDTYDAYAPFCVQPELVHDIHISKRDHIAPEALATKVADASAGPLKIIYAGRADAMKGPLDWIETLERLAVSGIDFRAIWLGGGADLAEMRLRIAKVGLGTRIETPGFVSDRLAVLEAIRQAHVFVFCHKTPESPRCLIEALVSATPIVGYDSAFPRDLIAEHGGGRLVPTGDVAALAEQLAALARDRDALGALIRRAAEAGAPFNDVSVFRHRSELIKRHLGADVRASQS